MSRGAWVRFIGEAVSVRRHENRSPGARRGRNLLRVYQKSEMSVNIKIAGRLRGAFRDRGAVDTGLNAGFKGTHPYAN